MQLWLPLGFLHNLSSSLTGIDMKSLSVSGLSDSYRLRNLPTPVEPTASSTPLCLLSFPLSQDIAPPLQQHRPIQAQSPHPLRHIPRHPSNLPQHSLLSLFLNLEFFPETSWLSPPSFFLDTLLLPLQASCCLRPRCVTQLLLLNCPPVSILQSMPIVDVKRITTCLQLPTTTNKTLSPQPQTGHALHQPMLLHKHFPSILILTF